MGFEALACNILWCRAVRYGSVRYGRVWCGAVRTITVRYSAVRCGAVLDNTCDAVWSRRDVYDTAQCDGKKLCGIVKCGTARQDKQCGTVWWLAVRSGAVWCERAVLYRTVLYGAARHGTLRYHTVQHDTARCDPIRYGAVRCGTVRYCTV